MTKDSTKYKFMNVRFNKTNAFDQKALSVLDQLCAVSGNSQTHIIKELLIRYGNAAMDTAVFDLSKTGLGSTDTQGAKHTSNQNGSAFDVDAYDDDPTVFNRK